MTTWLGDLHNWWNGPTDWEFGLFLAGIIAALLVSWRVLTYAVVRRVRQQSSGEPEMIFGVIIFVFGLVAGISAVPGTNGSMMFNVLAFIGGVAFVTGGIVWVFARTKAMRRRSPEAPAPRRDR
ncbi:MAG: hypothetical protein E6K02_01975 [Methanobacteriota archaeon]|nr:MAG: hypothetical protein E6K02_01975 [Euryarchaeota archaeon]